jgi:hypothetical protein
MIRLVAIAIAVAVGEWIILLAIAGLTCRNGPQLRGHAHNYTNPKIYRGHLYRWG